jgi:hypothetical protein
VSDPINSHDVPFQAIVCAEDPETLYGMLTAVHVNASVLVITPSFPEASHRIPL